MGGIVGEHQDEDDRCRGPEKPQPNLHSGRRQLHLETTWAWSCISKSYDSVRWSRQCTQPCLRMLDVPLARVPECHQRTWAEIWHPPDTKQRQHIMGKKFRSSALLPPQDCDFAFFGAEMSARNQPSPSSMPATCTRGAKLLVVIHGLMSLRPGRSFPTRPVLQESYPGKLQADGYLKQPKDTLLDSRQVYKPRTIPVACRSFVRRKPRPQHQMKCHPGSWTASSAPKRKGLWSPP